LLFGRERDPHRRTQLQALMLLRQGRGLSEVAAIVGLSCRTLQRWIGWYQHGGLAEVDQHWVGGHSGAARRLSPRQEAALTAKATAGEIRSVWDGVHWAASKGVSYSYWGMRWVLVRLQLKKKVPRPCNPKASRAQQRAWKKGG
jgi:transposase